MRAAFSTLVMGGLGVALACPSGGASQTIPSPYSFVEQRQEAGLFSGVVSASTGRFGFAPKGGMAFGMRYGIELSGPLSLAGGAGVVSGTRDIVSPSRPEGNRVVSEADVLLANLDMQLRLSATGARAWHGLAPYIAFGGGIVWDAAEKPAGDALIDGDEVFHFGTRFFGTAGSGVRWFVTPRIGVRGDLTLALWKIGVPSGYGDPALGFENVPRGEWVNALGLTATLLYRW